MTWGFLHVILGLKWAGPKLCVVKLIALVSLHGSWDPANFNELFKTKLLKVINNWDFN
jgi:hypothetical protein